MRLATLATCAIALTATAGCASPGSASASSPSDGPAEIGRAGGGESSAPFAALAAAIAPQSAPAGGDSKELPAAVAAAPVAPAAQRWEFSAAAFMWMAGLDSAIGVKGRTARASLSFTDIWDNLDTSVMVHLEAQKGNWSIFGDGIWIALSDTEKGPRGHLDITMNLDQAIAVGAAAYKFVDTRLGQPSSKDANDAARATVEVYGGVRYNDIRGKINPERFGSVRGDVTWWDPVVGVRARVDVTPRLALTTRADVGGFGGSDDASWFFMSGLDWKLTPCVFLGAGYAVLTQRYRDGNDPGDFSIKEKLHGPIVTVTLLF